MDFLTLLSLACLASPGTGNPCDLVAEMQPMYRGEVPPGFLLALNAPGVDYRYHPDADDQGPPHEIKECMVAATGATVTHIRLSKTTSARRISSCIT